MFGLNKVIEFLQKPFPQEETHLQTIGLISGISLFVFLFLYLFKPFGIGSLESGQFLLCLGFGGMTFLASIIYEYGIARVVGIKGGGARFTFWKWIIYFSGAMLSISLANFLFVRLVLFGDIQWALFPAMMRGTFAIGIIPIVFLGAMALVRQENKYQRISSEINLSDAAQPAAGNLAASAFGVPLKSIRYIEALQNYVKVGYINDDGQLAVKLERDTLKNALSKTENSAIVRCHRSFLVNKDAVVSTSGNAQGLLLALAECDKEIPVSRTFISGFRPK